MMVGISSCQSRLLSLAHKCAQHHYRIEKYKECSSANCPHDPDLLVPNNESTFPVPRSDGIPCQDRFGMYKSKDQHEHKPSSKSPPPHFEAARKRPPKRNRFVARQQQLYPEQ